MKRKLMVKGCIVLWNKNFLGEILELPHFEENNVDGPSFSISNSPIQNSVSFSKIITGPGPCWRMKVEWIASNVEFIKDESFIISIGKPSNKEFNYCKK